MSLKLYDKVSLKDGRTGSIIEILSEDCYLVELDSFFDCNGYYVGEDGDFPLEFAKKADIVAKAC
ncbi:MAG: hypothetical protein FWD49_01255 [Firmicutes bacterium]|nr:hypothetical protein [Bacillota bacterium]